MKAESPFSRSELLLGAEALDRLARSRVAVIGLGGVGSAAAEALARAGIGSLVLVDYDRVEVSNLNRQILALHSTVGRPKAEVMKERVLDINPACEVLAIEERYDPESAARILQPPLSYVVDAIDMVSSKIDLICRCAGAGIPVISSMGAAEKLDPSRLELADLADTRICPLARIMRKELRRRGITSLRVVYSREEAGGGPGAGPPDDGPALRPRLRPPHAAGVPVRRPSSPFVPAAAGLLLASALVRDILGLDDAR
ncbi:MAG TPA: tRNA threonylcarbamoyladenosine dehydratase [Rectinemataceae bacterium]|nr:tRNA threonylcarbamoyladenosine dehydratase [Rectinemataceae bacterium]